mmetsp:Transcript_7139/g.14569  ORF Transcript_7139/g.14569 Transcript_7139/m.14569 type:complete len:393 (-) Transcript_7139:408-1586(-)
MVHECHLCCLIEKIIKSVFYTTVHVVASDTRLLFPTKEKYTVSSCLCFARIVAPHVFSKSPRLFCFLCAIARKAASVKTNCLLALVLFRCSLSQIEIKIFVLEVKQPIVLKVHISIVVVQRQCCHGRDLVDRLLVFLGSDSFLLGRNRGGSGGGRRLLLFFFLLPFSFLLFFFFPLFPLFLLLFSFLLLDFFYFFGRQPYFGVLVCYQIHGIEGPAFLLRTVIVHPWFVVHQDFLYFLQDFVLVLCRGQARNFYLVSASLAPFLGNLAHQLVELPLDVRNLVPGVLRSGLVLSEGKTSLNDFFHRRCYSRVIEGRISIRLWHGIGFVEGHRILVDNHHLGNVTGFIIHCVIVCFVDLDRTRQVDQARGIRGPIAMEIPQRRAVLGRYARDTI